MIENSTLLNCSIEIMFPQTVLNIPSDQKESENIGRLEPQLSPIGVADEKEIFRR